MTSSFTLSGIRGLDSDALRQIESNYDLIFGAHCIESRCIRVPELLRTASARKIAYELQGDDPSLRRRKKWLTAYGFSVCPFDNNHLVGEIESVIQERTRYSSNEPIRVLVDVTSLPRRVIASILGEIISRCGLLAIDLSISYTLARYIPPSKSGLEPNKLVAPVHPFFAGWTCQPGLPVSAVMGLGYERGKALGAREYLQASDWFLFVPHSPEAKFRSKVEQHNRQLIGATRPERILDYEVLKPVQALHTLGSVVAGLKSYAKPVLLPFGPKIFFAVSALVAVAHPEASVWHVSGEEHELPVDRAPSAYTTGLRCIVKRIEHSADDE